MLQLAGIVGGPRSSHDPAGGPRTLQAYRAWAGRAGSQEAALRGDAGWAPQRRFARAFERLALPGLTRAARFDFLVTVGRLGIVELVADALHLGGAGASARSLADDPTTLAAKRVLGIGDAFLLERRAAELAEGTGLPLDALDLAFFNFGRSEVGRSEAGRATLGSRAQVDPQVRAALGATLGV